MAGSFADFAKMWEKENAPVPEAVLAQPDPDSDRALACIESGAPVVLVSGRAGTGKTRLIRKLQQGELGKRTLVVAPTGMTALNLGVPTLHTGFNLPIGCIDRNALAKPRRSLVALRAARRLVIDEISLVRADILDGVDARLREARRRDEPFGGVQVVMVGDFLQLEPVTSAEAGVRLKEMGYDTPFAFSAHVLKEMPIATVTLKTVWRQSDPSFKAALADVRAGQRIEEAIAWLNAQCTGPHRAGRSPLVLTTTRALAEEYNSNGLKEVFKDHACVRFEGVRTGRFENAEITPAPDILDLASTARVVALRNDPRGKFANGSLGTVQGFRDASEGQEEAVSVMFDGAVEPVWVERSSWERTQSAFSSQEGAIVNEVIGTFSQMPLAPGYALTVHKCQGLTLDDVRLDFSRGAFAPGQLYVALSRARTVEGMSFAEPLRPRDVQVNPMLRRFLEWAEERSLAG